MLSLFVKPFRKLIFEKGFSSLTEPELKAIPLIFKGENVLLIAPTGTGKTEAALLPLLQRMFFERGVRGVKLLYITPLRALNRDLLDRLEWWCGKLDLTVSVRHGDTETAERRKQAVAPPDLLITTPETLQIILNGKMLRETLRNLRWVVVDEVHELADSKRGSQLSLSLEKLRWTIGRDFQIIGLSATIGSPEKVARFLVGTNRKCQIVYVPVSKRMKIEIMFPRPIKLDYMVAEEIYTYPEVASRLRQIKNLVEEHRSTLIFTNTRSMAELLTNRLKIMDLKFPVDIHHGSLSKPVRLRAERGLKGGEYQGVICTSSLELGIDIGEIDFCIQYNSPRQVVKLVQRVGRSGHRVGEISRGVVIVQNPDDALEAMVIARRAFEDKLEEIEVPKKPFDVLMHELAGLLIVKGEWTVKEVLEIYRNSYPYRDLCEEDLRKILSYMDSLPNRFIFYDAENGFFRVFRGKSYLFKYYYENLSMIPEIKQYLVVDETDGLPVGVLDDLFIAEYGEPGAKFIMSGRPWTLLQVYNERVYVKPEDSSLGAVPSWVGEEIPVPFEVAQEVGFIRGKVLEMVGEGYGLRRIAEKLGEMYGVDVNVMERAVMDVYNQASRGLPVPSNEEILIEKFKDLLIVHAHFGTKINRAISRFLAHSLADLLGESVGVQENPYRIIIKTGRAGVEEVADLLLNPDAQSFENKLRKAVINSRFFKWRLIHVARRMGVIEREVRVTSQVSNQLLRALKGTPVYEEAFKEVLLKDLDVEGAKKQLLKAVNGELKVTCLSEEFSPSEVAVSALKYVDEFIEPVSADKRKMLMVLSAKARLLSQRRVFVCLDCREYVVEEGVFEALKVSKCPICGSKRIGMTNEAIDVVLDEIERLKERRKVKGKVWSKLERSARLFSVYGSNAFIALSSNLGLKEAEEFLKSFNGKRNIFEELVKAERRILLKRFNSIGGKSPSVKNMF